MDHGANPTIELPEPRLEGGPGLAEMLAQRRSVRSFASAPLTLEELSQLAWAVQGITDAANRFRSAPSAGATYPLEVDLLVSGMAGIPDGVYRYRPQTHRLERRLAGDLHREVHDAALRQHPVITAPVVMVISGQLARTAPRYGARATRYMFMEAGHAAQNVYLQATALGIGTVAIGAFDDEGLATALQLAPGEQPLYLLPLGRPR